VLETPDRYLPKRTGLDQRAMTESNYSKNTARHVRIPRKHGSGESAGRALEGMMSTHH
jgi:hypothetical protein